LIGHGSDDIQNNQIWFDFGLDQVIFNWSTLDHSIIWSHKLILQRKLNLEIKNVWVGSVRIMSILGSDQLQVNDFEPQLGMDLCHPVQALDQFCQVL